MPPVAIARRSQPLAVARPRAPRRNKSGGARARPTRLRARLADAEATLRAIRTGEVDTVMVAGKEGSQVFTLDGAEHAYRVLIECMNEGALTLTADKTILYANQCFARMVKCPLEQVTGSSFRRFLSAEDGATLRPLMQRAGKFGAKIQVRLIARDGSQMPAQISIRPLAGNGSRPATIGMVVTDTTEGQRNEDRLRALTQRVVEAQEAERGRVALELHDHITQLLCAVLVRSQTLADKLSAGDGAAKREAVKLRELLGQTAEEVERISRELRPSVLDELGLVAVLREATAEFAERTGVTVQLNCGPLTAELPAEARLALYRIFQEAMKNIEHHAQARHVTLWLSRPGTFMKLIIQDDGIGLVLAPPSARRKNRTRFGMLSMRERANYVGGTLKIKPARRGGTEIEVRIPFGPSPRGASHRAAAQKPGLRPRLKKHL